MDCRCMLPLQWSRVPEGGVFGMGTATRRDRLQLLLTAGGSVHRSDVEDIKFVINYDYPNSSEDYVHRIGRTARSTNKGTAYTFFTPGNIKQARELIKVLQEANQAINPKLMQLVDHGRGGGGGGGRSRYRSIPTSNNPNMMYMDECNRRLRGKDGGRAGGGGSSFRDRDRDRGDSSTFNGANRGTYGAMGAQPTQYPFNQGTYGAPGATYGTSGFGGQDFNANNYNTGANATNNTVAGRSMPTTGQPLQQQQQQQQQQPTQPQQPFGAAAPRPNQGPQPLMAQQFAPPPPPTPGMNYMGQSGTYQYQPPPPPPPPPTRK